MRCSALIVSVALALAGGVAEAQSASSATAWHRWEQALSSSKSYTNPYADAALSVTFSGPGGQTLKAGGFWDGGSTFRIRCAFPAAGTWTWSTACSDTSDTGLHNRSGSVSVAAYTGTNPLYKRGLLKVAAGRRHLTFADGTPFLWMGDTAWVAPLKASQADWQAYVDDRAAKRFTVIQISPASSWGGSADTAGNAPFLGSGISPWNPPYWQGFDKKVEYANQKGFVVLLVGIMEPTTRYPTSAEASLFARNIAARLHGSHVILSPSFDSPYRTLGDDAGSALNGATGAHLITQHVGTSLDAARSYYDKGYLDFSGCQSGHNGGDREACANRAIAWNLDLYSRSPCKPVVNLEAFYDAGGTTAGMDAKYLGTAKDARQLGYLSWMSGSLGYTYGAYGLWNWQTDSSKGYFWSKAVQFPSSTQMKYMSDLFNGIEWWRLAPAHGLIQNQPSAYLQRMVLAKSGNGDLAVAYLPDNASIRIDMTAFPTAMSGRWYNPVQGSFTDIAGTIPNTGSATLNRPGSGDWALLLKPAAAPPPPAGTFPAKINFQPAGAAVPAGYLPDAGAVFADRGNGWAYGWNADHSDVTRERGINADRRLDTLCHFHAGGKWEIAAPNGSYAVTLGVGDAGFESTHTVNVEGVGYWSGLPLAANQFAKLTKTVTVADGRLTIDQGSAADKATRINYVEIAPPGGFTVTVDGVSTGKAYSLSTAKAGALYYIDRSYTISSLGAALNGQPMIRTANDDKAVTASAHLRFTVSRSATVYACCDKRATALPAWLKDGTWTAMAESVAVSDAGASPMRVYAKSVGAGQVTLGGNHEGGNTGALSNYFVVVNPGISLKADLLAAEVPEDVWDHPGDGDGDGLFDDFEAANGLDASKADTDGDGEMDETELAADGRTLWEAQGDWAPSAGGDEGSDGGGCGATGMEVVLVLGLLALARRGGLTLS